MIAKALRVGSASLRNADPDRLTSAAQDPDPLMRVTVAGHARTPPAVLSTLATDECWAVSFEAIANPACPPEAKAVATADPWMCGRFDSLLRRRGAAARDPYAVAVYAADQQWRGQPPISEPFQSADDAAIFARRVLEDPTLCDRYPHVADHISTPLHVIFNRRLRTAGGRSDRFSAEIDLAPKWAVPQIVLHELAHQIIDRDPRYQMMSPLPQAHGPEFTAALLDLAEVVYGSEGRLHLKSLYEDERVDLLEPDTPLRPVSDEWPTELLPPVAERSADSFPTELTMSSSGAIAMRGFCDRVVVRTGMRCLLKHSHGGHCRSRL